MLGMWKSQLHQIHQHLSSIPPSPLCSCHNCVHHLDDSVQSWVSSDCHVSSTEVVVNGANHPHDVKGWVLLNSISLYQTWKDQQVRVEPMPPVCFPLYSYMNSDRLLLQPVDIISQDEQQWKLLSTGKTSTPLCTIRNIIDLWLRTFQIRVEISVLRLFDFILFLQVLTAIQTKT